MPTTAEPPAHKMVNLALQGGGAHGAFTWGVLDRLLEDGRLAFDGLSGASAGAMNAVNFADGLAFEIGLQTVDGHFATAMTGGLELELNRGQPQVGEFLEEDISLRLALNPVNLTD